MTPAGTTLLDQALQLPEQDRAELAARLLESLDAQVDEDAERAWADEIERRLNDLDSGKVKPIPWPEARAVIRGSSGGDQAH